MSVETDKLLIELDLNDCAETRYIKAIGFADLCSNKTKIFIIKPPFDKIRLSLVESKQIKYNEKNIHGLKWESGEISYELYMNYVLQLFEEFLDYYSNSITIYTKGNLKRDIVQGWVELSPIFRNRVKVVDLSDHSCPAFPTCKKSIVNKINFIRAWYKLLYNIHY
jgi:hypothetical protein